MNRGTWFQLVDDEMERIGKYETEFLTGKRLVKILPDRIIVEDTKTSMLSEILVDGVVLSLGVRPVNELAKKLDGKYKYVVAVGDAKKSGRIADAVHDAFNAVMRIK